MPIEYDLLINPDLTPWKSGNDKSLGGFSGTVKIILDVKKPTNEIVLHSHELEVTAVKFTSPDNSTIRVLVIAEHQMRLHYSRFLNILELFFDTKTRAVKNHSQWRSSRCNKLRA